MCYTSCSAAAAAAAVLLLLLLLLYYPPRAVTSPVVCWGDIASPAGALFSNDLLLPCAMSAVTGPISTTQPTACSCDPSTYSDERQKAVVN
jgi:hypothetical protein